MQRSTVYVASTDGEIRQGEILSDFPYDSISPNSILQEGTPVVRRLLYRYVIVLSQDCDLMQHYYAFKELSTNEQNDPEVAAQNAERMKGHISSILLCDAQPAQTLLAGIMGKDIRRRVKQNQDERYHCLYEVDLESDFMKLGIESLAIDFRHYFAVPPDELYAKLQKGVQRRCCLQSPFMEQLVARFYNYQSRIALPPVEEPTNSPD